MSGRVVGLFEWTEGTVNYGAAVVDKVSEARMNR
jgi:hypothetical protein